MNVILRIAAGLCTRKSLLSIIYSSCSSTDQCTETKINSSFFANWIYLSSQLTAFDQWKWSCGAGILNSNLLPVIRVEPSFLMGNGNITKGWLPHALTMTSAPEEPSWYDHSLLTFLTLNGTRSSVTGAWECDHTPRKQALQQGWLQRKQNRHSRAKSTTRCFATLNFLTFL